MTLRWIGALPSEMPHDATVVACLDSVTATATFATATSIRCGGLLARAASTVGLGLPTALARSLLLDQIVQRHIQSRHRSDGKARTGRWLVIGRRGLIDGWGQMTTPPKSLVTDIRPANLSADHMS
jgi:hypothetical protein